MMTKNTGKSRTKNGSLCFSKDEFLIIQQRIKNNTIATKNKNVDINKSNIQPASINPNPLKLVPKLDTTKKISTKHKSDIESLILNKTEEDTDWTTPRTVKLKKYKSGKSVNLHVKDVIDSIKYSTVLTSTSSEHLSLIFDGARLLTLNEILALMHYKPYFVFNYKTAWKNKIDEALLLAKDKHKAKMPEFSDSCIFIGFRRSTRLVDRDGLPACFKYILDDLRNQFVLPERILKDDNPNLIVDTPCFQTKGSHMVGIRLERVLSWTEPVINDSILLTPHGIAKNICFAR